MRTPDWCKWLTLALAVVLAPLAHAHSEHDKARFVAPGGVDTGRCDSAARPCATIAYAARNASKGDRILVAGGIYPIDDPADLFHLQSGLLDVELGYSRYDHFLTADANANPVTLTGVPPEFRESLMRRGFAVIADRKRLAGERLAVARDMLKAVEQMRVAKSSDPCSGGSAGGLACNAVDLLAHLPLNGFALNPSGANDIWGFIDLNTDREYVLIGLNNGVAVVDVTDPEAPVEVGNISGESTTWRDIKVVQRYDAASQRFEAYGYVTADGVSDQLRIIDLTDLPNAVSLGAASSVVRNAHNVYVSDADYASGLAIDGNDPALHIAGSNLGVGQVRNYTLDDPLAPSFEAATPGGYTHDAASLTIRDARAGTQCGTAGPCRVLADFNESTVDLWDVSALDAPALLSSTPYTNASYTHSGWPTEDGQFLFVHDELDEQQRGLNTTVRVFSLADLTQPTEVGSYIGATTAIDHNGFSRGNRYYMSNYERGLVVLDITDAATPTEVGFLDTFAPSDRASFLGAWGAYPFLPSGTVAVSDGDSGLYLARDRSLSSASGVLAFERPSAAAAEGAMAQLPVTRTGGAAGAVSVDYRIVAASATEADIAGPLTGTLNWGAGDSSAQTISIPAAVDADSGEPLERLLVHLVNPTGGATIDVPATASVFIEEPGVASELAFAASAVQVDEAERQVVLSVRRIGTATGAVSVDYSTAGSAALGDDIVGPASGSLSWADGDGTARSIVYTVQGDSADESDETLTLTLDNAQGASIAGPTATVTIADNDAGGGGGSITPAPPSSSSGGGGGALGGATLLVLLIAVRRRTGRAE